MEIGRIPHRRPPGAELVTLGRVAVDAKKIAAPNIAVPRCRRIQTPEWNAHHRVDGHQVASLEGPAHGGDEARAIPVDIRMHREASSAR